MYARDATYTHVFNGITDGYQPRVRLVDDAGNEAGNEAGKETRTRRTKEEERGGREGREGQRGEKTENDSGVL